MPTNTVTSAETVLLTGGPRTLADDQRIRTVARGTDKIKIQVGRGYEHFRDTGVSTDGLRVFRWSERTSIAE